MEGSGLGGGGEGKEEERGKGEGSSGSGIPVVEKEKKKRRMKKVLVAMDESEESFSALTWSLDNLIPSDDERRTTLILLHVQQPFQHFIYPAGPAVYATTAMIDSVRKAQEQNSAVLLTRALEACKGRMINVETLILDGDPKDMICQAAEQAHVDLIVVGSRGLGKIKRAFLGSVSDYCAHHTKCPVLIVKPPK